jgi:hypothetical protein
MLRSPPKVRKEDYRGFGPTIKAVAGYIRECGDDPSFQRFTANVLDKCFPRSQHTTALQRAQCLLTYQNQYGPRFVPDPPGTERVVSPKQTMMACAGGAGGEACIAMEDCESQLCAYLAMCRSCGIDCWILLQKLDKPNTDEHDPDSQYEYHMAGLVRLDDGSRVRVDPSLKGNSKVGQSQPALEEQIIDPLDPSVTGSAGGAKLVTIGATPRVLWTQRSSALRQMPSAVGACCAECAEHGGDCTGKKKPKAVLSGLRQMPGVLPRRR